MIQPDGIVTHCQWELPFQSGPYQPIILSERPYPSCPKPLFRIHWVLKDPLLYFVIFVPIPRGTLEGCIARPLRYSFRKVLILASHCCPPQAHEEVINRLPLGNHRAWPSSHLASDL